MNPLVIDYEKYKGLLDKNYEKRLGKVVKVVGLTLESIGPSAKLGDMCCITSGEDREQIMAEVVGFREDRVLLMPYSEIVGVGIGSRVENTGNPLTVKVGNELLGRTLDGLGNPIDGDSIPCDKSIPVTLADEFS